MSIKLFSASFVVFLIIFLIAAIYFHLSLWFLWHLLPEGNLKIAVNSSQPGSEVITQLLRTSPIKEDTAKLLSNTKRYSYSQTEDMASIALVPKNPFLFKDRNILINELNNNNWRTINFGLIIVGTNTDETPSTSPLKTVISKTSRKLLSRQHPYRPTVIAQSRDGALPILSDNTALVGVISNKSKELKIIVAPDLDNLPNFSISGPSLPNQANHLAINVPGTVIQSVSSQFSKEWNEIIHSKLGFIETKPPIISYMAVQQTSSMIITDEKAAIALIGDPVSLKDTFHQWMQQEEAYSRPQRHAFRLPDRTLGYELVKGDTQPVLSDADPSGCFAPTTEAIKLWLCQNDKGISIATNQEDALNELASISSSAQSITLGSDYLKKLDFLPVQHFQSLAFYSSGEYTILTISLKSNQ